MFPCEWIFLRWTFASHCLRLHCVWEEEAIACAHARMCWCWPLLSPLRCSTWTPTNRYNHECQRHNATSLIKMIIKTCGSLLLWYTNHCSMCEQEKERERCSFAFEFMVEDQCKDADSFCRNVSSYVIDVQSVAK